MSSNRQTHKIFYTSQGVLRVHVIEARHLMKKDISMLGKGKSDPYAVVTVGAQEFKTKVIDNNVDPKWDYWCEVSGIVSFFFSFRSAAHFSFA